MAAIQTGVSPDSRLPACDPFSNLAAARRSQDDCYPAGGARNGESPAFLGRGFRGIGVLRSGRDSPTPCLCEARPFGPDHASRQVRQHLVAIATLDFAFQGKVDAASNFERKQVRKNPLGAQ